MLSQEERNKVDRIWLDFHSNGIAIPSDVIEQFNYLIFLRQLDEREATAEADAELLGEDYEPEIFRTEEQQAYRWSRLLAMTDVEERFRLVQGEVFPFLKTLGSEESAFGRYMEDAVFKIPTPLALDKIMLGIEELALGDEDSKGDLYEYMLSKLGTSKVNGQFRTPRHIIRMMVEMASPQPEDCIVDPAMGSAGFLVAAEEYVRAHHREALQRAEVAEHFQREMFHGFDNDTTMLRIGAMNLMLHGLGEADIAYKSSLSETGDKGRYTLVLANPPFKGTLDAAQVNPALLKIASSKSTEILFLALVLHLLAIGGRAAVIIPAGILFGSSRAHKAIRKALIDDNKLEAVVSMPSGVFKPYAGVATAILFFVKTDHGGTEDVWFYDMKADGYSLDDKRTPVEENDIEDILARWGNLAAEKDRKRTEQSFLVPVEEIRANGYDLSYNKYKEIEYTPVEYPSTEELLAELDAVEADIAKEMGALRGMLRVAE